MNNFTSAKQTDLHFEKKSTTKKSFINSIVNECAFYGIVDISVLVFNLWEPTSVVKNVKLLQITKGMIKDNIDKMPIVIIESQIEQIPDESCYDMTNMQKQRCLDEQILKANLTLEVSSNKDIGVIKNDDCVYISPNETKIFWINKTFLFTIDRFHWLISFFLLW